MARSSHSDTSLLRRLLVVRPDRLGDVILSTPVFRAIKDQYPEMRLTALVRENVVPILQGLSSLDQCFTYDPQGRHSGLKGLLKLRSEIRNGNFDAAVSLNTHWKIALAIWMAGVPL